MFTSSCQKLSNKNLIKLYINLLSFLINCCVFRPAFGYCTHPKAGRNLFFGHFSTFLVHFKAFSVCLIQFYRFTTEYLCLKFPCHEQLCASKRSTVEGHRKALPIKGIPGDHGEGDPQTPAEVDKWSLSFQMIKNY